MRPRSAPLASAAFLLGAGMGGFVDGILLHQILQWHNMLSSVIPPTDVVSIKVNMVWDGLFHLLTWVMTAAGLGRLWTASLDRSARWDTGLFVGGLAIGWGSFNVVEGLIDHHLLGLHHVHPGEGQLAWDLGFLALGVALIAFGVVTASRGRRPFPRQSPA